MTIGIDKRVQINKIIESQLPEFVRSDFENATEIFKQYYISQEFQGGQPDLIDNLDQYLKSTNNLVPEVVYGKTTLSSSIDASSTTLSVTSTKGILMSMVSLRLMMKSSLILVKLTLSLLVSSVVSVVSLVTMLELQLLSIMSIVKI